MDTSLIQFQYKGKRKTFLCIMLKKQCLFSNFSLGDNIVVSGLNGLGLIVLCLDELVLEFCDGFDTLVGEGDEASIEGLLLGQQSLDGGQVASVVVGADLSLFVCRGIKKEYRN